MVRALIDVMRCEGPGKDSWHQVFAYETADEGATVATALRELNERAELTDVDGRPAERIRWDCGCLQRKCGACAMVINGEPRAACDVRLSEVRGRRVRLEPLRKFPLVADLVVDRSVVFERLKHLEAWTEQELPLPVGERSTRAFEASRCLQCGCCLEVCPNFSVQGSFGGMAAMVELARLLAEASGEERERLRETYRAVIFAGCGKSLACRRVCPAGIDLAHLMARSNAVAVWRRR